MSEPKVSERMFNLVTDFGADCINYGCNQLRPMVGYPLIENVQHRAKEVALYSAIAEIEQRAEKAEQERDKWREVAVALHEAALLMKGLTLTKRLGAAWHSLGPLWDEAVR